MVRGGRDRPIHHGGSGANHLSRNQFNKTNSQKKIFPTEDKKRVVSNSILDKDKV